MNDAVRLLVGILAIAVVVYAVNELVKYLELPPMIRNIAVLVVALIALLFILQLLGVMAL